MPVRTRVTVPLEFADGYQTSAEVVTFTGLVRRSSQGRAVDRLEVLLDDPQRQVVVALERQDVAQALEVEAHRDTANSTPLGASNKSSAGEGSSAVMLRSSSSGRRLSG